MWGSLVCLKPYNETNRESKVQKKVRTGAGIGPNVNISQPESWEITLFVPTEDTNPLKQVTQS